MNIIHLPGVVSRLGYGVKEAVLQLAEKQADNIENVFIFALGDKYTYEVEYELNKKKFYTLIFPYIGPVSPAYAPRLYTTLKNFFPRPDIIHVHGLWSYYTFIGGRVARELDIPLVISPHGTLSAKAMRYSRLKKKIAYEVIEGKNLKYASVLFALTKKEKNDIKKILPDKDIRIIPNGVNNELAKNVLSLKNNKKKNLLFIGRIDPIKRIDIIINSWKEVKKFYKDYRLVIAGPVHNKEYYRKLRKIAGDDNSIHFMGPVYGEEKVQLLSESKVFLHSSDSEGLPMAVLEALSCKIPVLITRTCNLDDIKSFNAGYISELSVEAYTDNLKKFLNLSEDKVIEMGNNAAKLIDAKYRWDIIAKKSINIYKEITENGK